MMRFNHMELTLEPGALDEPNRSELIDFYHELFGWNLIEPNLFDKSDVLFTTDDFASSFILLVQVRRHLREADFYTGPEPRPDRYLDRRAEPRIEPCAGLHQGESTHPFEHG